MGARVRVRVVGRDWGGRGWMGEDMEGMERELGRVGEAVGPSERE
jgi:hypothetical protein